MAPQQLSTRLELARTEETLSLARHSLAVLDGTGQPTGEPFTAAEIGLFRAAAAQQHFPTWSFAGPNNRAIYLHQPAADFLAYAVRHPDGIVLSTGIGQAEAFVGMFPDIPSAAERVAEGLSFCARRTRRTHN